MPQRVNGTHSQTLLLTLSRAQVLVYTWDHRVGSRKRLPSRHVRQHNGWPLPGRILSTLYAPSSATDDPGAIHHCITGPAGYYCPSSNVPTIVPTLLCANGYVCPAGSATSNPLPCPGKRSLLLSRYRRSNLSIVAGRYVPNTTPIKGSLNDCILCPAGSYCLQAFDGSYNNTCPPGIALAAMWPRAPCAV